MAQPHGAQPLCPLWGGGSQSHPSPAPAHKLQSVPWEHGSSRGVDGFGGFKLVPGSWKKENNPAETWQGTGLQPVPEGDNSPTATGTRRLAAQEKGTGRMRRRRVPGSALCHSTGEAMAGSPCTPTFSIPTCAACVPKQAAGISTSPSGRLGSSSPSMEAQGLEAMPAQGRATGSLPAPCTGTGTRKGTKSFSVPGPDGHHSSCAGE